MKKMMILILTLLSVVGFTTYAEEVLGEDAKAAVVDVENGWGFGGVIGLNLNQSAFNNWAPGGENSYSATGILNLNASFTSPTIDRSVLNVSTFITDPQYVHALSSFFSAELPQLKHFI